MDKQEIIKKDRMRFKNNNLSSNLCLLGLVFNVLYFIVVYKVNDIFLYKPLIGVSVIYNLLFMLTIFLASIKVKNYNFAFSIVAIVVAVLQIVRIFIIPVPAKEAGVIGVAETDYENTFTFMLIWLLGSCLSLVAAGVTSIIRTFRRKEFINAVDRGDIDISFISAHD